MKTVTEAAGVGLSQIQCRYCGDVLTLNQDSMEAREQGTDPLRQMQRHLRECQAIAIFEHGFKNAILLNMMAFRAVNSPENWREYIALVVDSLLKEPV